jgi:hypothetical protein
MKERRKRMKEGRLEDGKERRLEGMAEGRNGKKDDEGKKKRNERRKVGRWEGKKIGRKEGMAEGRNVKKEEGKEKIEELEDTPFYPLPPPLPQWKEGKLRREGRKKNEGRKAKREGKKKARKEER